jgi:hypothetical protein
MITIASTFGPWVGERSIRQELWMHAWARQFGCRMVAFDQGEGTTSEQASKFNHEVCFTCPKAETVTGIEGDGLAMNKMFEILDGGIPDNSWAINSSAVCLVNDSVPAVDHVEAIVDYFIKTFGPRCCLFARHIDLNNWAPDLRRFPDESLTSIRAAAAERGTIHFPGAGFFAWPREYFSEVAKSCPPMNYLYGGSEEYFWTRTLDDDALLVDITPALRLIHLCHPRPVHREPCDGVLNHAKTKDPQILHVYKFIPKTVQEIWDRVQPKLSVFDNGMAVIECCLKGKVDQNGK